MSLTTIITGTQKRSKDSYASSPTVGLALRVNGEETPKIIDSVGNVYEAGIAAPTVAPTVVLGAGGAFADGWVGYVYVYASSRFPFVETDLAINGRVWPRSNASPLASAHFTGGNNQVANTSTVTKTTAAGVTNIWIFRTALFPTQVEAETAAAAGEAFFVTELVNNGVAGTVTWSDNNPVDSADQLQSDNYVAPQMQFAVFYDPYWWGFGNLPFNASATWTTTGVVTITSPNSWFDGRNNQNMTLSGITTGGFNGTGTFYFHWLSATTAQASLTPDTITAPTIAASGAGATVTVQGPATTLFRSKPRNPFAWGLTETIGTANVPREYAFKIGGGLGTALAVIPNNATLKLDCEYPAKCFTLNLRTAGTSAFENTLRIISDVYSVSAHFSQFPAVTQSGDTVLWGMDFKNFVIVQSDGNVQVPISGPIPRVLRALTTDRTSQLLTHGVYDPRTELNCIWVRTAAGLSLVNYLIYQHAPSGFWGFSEENDILCSATIQDSLTGTVKTFVGTQTGLLGQAFVEGVYNNFLPDTGEFTGVCTAATQGPLSGGTAPSLTIAGNFNTTDNGIVGNWCLVTDPLGQNEQLARISAVSAHTITFDWVRSAIGGYTDRFNPAPVAGWLFYIGLIECRLLKYFDLNSPQTDKQLMEIWVTQQGVDTSTLTTLVRFYRERITGYDQFAMMQAKYEDTEGSNVWFTDQDVPSELVKMFGLEFINRGYQQWRFLNLILKPRLNP